MKNSDQYKKYLQLNSRQKYSIKCLKCTAIARSSLI